MEKINSTPDSALAHTSDHDQHPLDESVGGIYLAPPPFQFQSETPPASPPNGSGTLLPCGHRAQAPVIQRMIEKEVPQDAQKDLDALKTYVYATPVNKRKQTFEQAALAHGLTTLMSTLEKEIRDQNLGSVIRRINAIRNRVNGNEMGIPSHPNKVWGKNQMGQAIEHDAPFAVSNTPESQEIAKKIQKRVLQLINPDAKFMLGVLVLPSGKVIVGVSGAGRDFSNKVKEAVQNTKISCFENTIFTPNHISKTDMGLYRNAAANHLDKHKQERRDNDRNPLFDYAKGDNDRIERQRGEYKQDLGSSIGKCAAPVLLSVAKTKARDEFSGESMLGMTEVWIAKKKDSSVMVYNSETGTANRFNHEAKDVASCHTCQMELEPVAREVVAMEKAGYQKRMLAKVNEGREALGRVQSEIHTLEQLLAEKEQNEKLAVKVQGILEEAKAKNTEMEAELEAFQSEYQQFEESKSKLEADLKKQEEDRKAKREEADNFARDETNIPNQKRDYQERGEKIEKLEPQLAHLKQKFNELENTTWDFSWKFDFWADWYARAEALKREFKLKPSQDGRPGLNEVPDLMRGQIKEKSSTVEIHENKRKEIEKKAYERGGVDMAEKDRGQAVPNLLDSQKKNATAKRKELRSEVKNNIEPEIKSTRAKIAAADKKLERVKLALRNIKGQIASNQDKLEKLPADFQGYQKKSEGQQRARKGIQAKSRIANEMKSELELNELRLQGANAALQE